MVINNQEGPTVTGSQFLEQNITQDCDISLDPEMNLDCCEIVKGIQEWKYIYNFIGFPCGLFYKCDKPKKSFHCVLNDGKIMAFGGFIFVIVIVGIVLCYSNMDLIRRKLNNLFPKRISGRTAENNSMEMN